MKNIANIPSEWGGETKVKGLTVTIVPLQQEVRLEDMVRANTQYQADMNYAITYNLPDKMDEAIAAFHKAGFNMGEHNYTDIEEAAHMEAALKAHLMRGQNIPAPNSGSPLPTSWRGLVGDRSSLTAGKVSNNPFSGGPRSTGSTPRPPHLTFRG